MESIISLIKARRSCRKFNNQLPTADQVKTLEKAALLAPTSKTTDPGTSYLLLTQKLLIYYQALSHMEQPS